MLPNVSRMPARALLAAMLALAGCSQDYTGERLFWKADRISAPLIAAIKKNPERVSPEQFSHAVEAFTRVMQQTPGTVWAVRAQLAIGILSVAQKQYAKARGAFSLVVQNYNQYSDLCLKARIEIAKTYELEQNWEEAVAVYYQIADHHPWSKVGLEVPLYVAKIYEVRKNAEHAEKAYERAVNAYTKLIPEAPAPELGVQVKGYLAQAYQGLGVWDQAARVLEDLLTAQSGVNRPLTLLMLGSIYQTKLASAERAGEIYAKLLQEFPEHPFGKVAKTQLDHLGIKPMLQVP